ncbi:hypothetical protein LCGC14_0336340 [marine sediment metagenome]|uniref:Uncharacterized protein n=1 Tax=marine sediment metagenome TaxID=412755 RepID=A0A0F9TKL4_9ZZZZ
MGRGYFDITPELLVSLCKALDDTQEQRFYRVIDDPIPRDASDISAESHMAGSFRLNDDRLIRISFSSAQAKDGQRFTPTLTSEAAEEALSDV